ncbi:MAG: histidine triad nucleotide-binding protein [Cellulomonadaceae bacterium]|jgi:histidine triad (HIT) family protein|nr:histidine triad nucleotide-binding protein [Cellulomonadaceae bacterium]
MNTYVRMTEGRKDPDCIFCKIVAGDVPAEFVDESPGAVAFKDINPQAPVHLLVIPREHYGDVSELAATNPQLMAEMVDLAAQVAGDLADGQFRLIFNSGPRAGQSVYHVHGHVLAGADLGWTPA